MGDGDGTDGAGEGRSVILLTFMYICFQMLAKFHNYETSNNSL